ncbi:MAG TPA: hypothetical protein ENN65_02645, partial [Candidatus Hydrogenedentes bacterium]|nr:hypothetical protein [Candidatus Hydrogenedentota bacterium]
MASCTQIESFLQAYIDGELSTAEKVIFEQHIAECRMCDALLKRQKANSALLFESLNEQRLREDLTPAVMAHLPEMDHDYRLSHEVTLRAKQPGRSLFFRVIMPVFATAAVLLMGAALLYIWPKSDSAVYREVGMVTYQQGKVLRSRENSTERIPTLVQTVVLTDERFETGENAGLVIGLVGPSYVKLHENTRLKVEHERELSLERGRIWLKVANSDRAYFRVLTPSGDITVFGTIFDVHVTDHGTTVTVAEGAVQVENERTFTVLNAGEQVELMPGRKPLRKMAVDAYARMAWASELHSDPKAERLFLANFRHSERIRAEQVFVVDVRRHLVHAITFEWRPDAFDDNHCGYHILVSDEHMNQLFTGYIDAGVFENKENHIYELPV